MWFSFCPKLCFCQQSLSLSLMIISWFVPWCWNETKRCDHLVNLPDWWIFLFLIEPIREEKLVQWICHHTDTIKIIQIIDLEINYRKYYCKHWHLSHSTFYVSQYVDDNMIIWISLCCRNLIWILQSCQNVRCWAAAGRRALLWFRIV